MTLNGSYALCCTKHASFGTHQSQSVVGFSVIPKCMTLNGCFALIYVYAQVCLASDRATFENNN